MLTSSFNISTILPYSKFKAAVLDFQSTLLPGDFPSDNTSPLTPVITVIIRIKAAAFIKFLTLKMRRLFEGGVYSGEAFVANLVTTTVNLLSHRKSLAKEREKSD